jgi:hypothetical protein
VKGHARIDSTAHTTGVVDTLMPCIFNSVYHARSTLVAILRAALQLLAPLRRALPAAIGRNFHTHQRPAKDLAASSFVLWIHVGSYGATLWSIRFNSLIFCPSNTSYGATSWVAHEGQPKRAAISISCHSGTMEIGASISVTILCL